MRSIPPARRASWRTACCAVTLLPGALLLVGLSGCSQNASPPVATTRISSATRLNLADIAAAGGDVESARTIIAAAAEHDPGNADLQIRYANALMDSGRNEQASLTAANALAQHPRDTALALRVGQVQLRAHDPAGAALTFQKVPARGPDGVAALNGLGVARVQQSDVTTAIQVFRHAVAISPGDFAARNNLALALVLAGQSDEAVPILEALAAMPGAPGRVKHNLALAYARLGNAQQAAGVLAGVVGPDAAAIQAASLVGTQRLATDDLVSRLAPVEVLGGAGPHADLAAAPPPAQTAAAEPAPPARPATRHRTLFGSWSAPWSGKSQVPPPQPAAVPGPQQADFVAPQLPGNLESALPLRPAAAVAQAAQAPPAAPARTEDVRVQIAVLPSREAAAGYWQNLAERVPDLLGGRAPVITQQDEAWHVGTGGFRDAADAERFCTALRVRGLDCLAGS